MSAPRQRRPRVLRALVVVALTALAVAAFTGPAAAADTEAPEWGNATKGNATTIEVTVYDEGTLDTSSITASDFALTDGRFENITVTSINASGANRTGARVSIHLEERLDVNNVTVGLQSGASIADTAGNTLTDGTVTVTGMDTRTPRYEGFEKERINSSTVELTLTVNERLGNLTLSVGGPEVDTLSIANFSETVDGSVTYTTRYTAPEEGEYSFLVLSVADRYGNDIRFGHQVKFRYDGSAPNVTLEGPTTAEVGAPVNFTAANSTDDQRIERFRWRIDGGTIIPGDSITVAFATPGTHELSVAVTDPFGNTAVETRQVAVVGEGVDGTVNVTERSATRAVARVNSTGTAQRIRVENGSLVSGANASLDRIRTTFPANESVALEIRARDRTPSSFATATGALGLVRFDVDHGSVTADGATFTFAVSRTALERVGADPAAVTLYRDEGGWVPLETAVVGQSDSRVVYQATSPGLSTFVVGVGADPSTTGSTDQASERQDGGETDAEPAPSATEQGTPEVEVTNVTVSPEEPAEGEQAVVTVDLANRGTATGDYRVTVFLNGSALTSRVVTVPAGETRTTEFARELPEGGTLAVGTRQVTNVSSSGGGLSMPAVSLPTLSVPIPNPLALWPSGIVGTILSVVVGLVVVVYSILKALAIYLGY